MVSRLSLVAGGVLLLAAAGTSYLLWSHRVEAGAGSSETGSRRAESPAPAVAPAPKQAAVATPEPAAQEPRLPPELTTAYPPGSKVLFEVPKVDHGLGLPDGTFVPLLNGVEVAPPLNSSSRPKEWGPIPPMIGKVVDGGGFDWYLHADGSTTTTRPQEAINAEGEHYITIVTLHSAKVPDNLLVEVPPDAGGTLQPGDPGRH